MSYNTGTMLLLNSPLRPFPAFWLSPKSQSLEPDSASAQPIPHARSSRDACYCPALSADAIHEILHSVCWTRLAAALPSCWTSAQRERCEMLSDRATWPQLPRQHLSVALLRLVKERVAASEHLSAAALHDFPSEEPIFICNALTFVDRVASIALYEAQFSIT